MALLRRMVLPIIVILVLFYLLYCTFLFVAQGRLVFSPSNNMAFTPEETGLPIEEVYLSSEGYRIVGWYMPATDSSSLRHRYVLFFHGNAGNISHRVTTFETLYALGVNVLGIDYRGYGLSEGKPTEQGLYQDAETAYKWLCEEKGINPESIFLFGRSLGGAVAIELATRVPSAGLIVESSFSSVADMGALAFPLVPTRLLLRYKFDSVSKIGKVNVPVLFGHSPADNLVPYRMGRALYEQANSPKGFLELQGSHNELSYLETDSYHKTLKRFLETGNPQPVRAENE